MRRRDALRSPAKDRAADLVRGSGGRVSASLPLYPGAGRGPAPQENGAVAPPGPRPWVPSKYYFDGVPSPGYRSTDHRQVQSLLARAVDGDVVAGVGVAHDPGAGVVPQHALQPPRRVVGAVGDDHHSGVLRIAHADPPAVMERH